MAVDGAGIILVKVVNGKFRFLGLLAPETIQKKSGGIFDIPKGVAEPDESFWECAARECLEETGILVTDQDKLAGPFRIKWLTVWLCQTAQEPLIERNPHSGILEHVGYEWLEPQELSGLSYIYLKPFVDWAIKELT